MTSSFRQSLLLSAALLVANGALANAQATPLEIPTLRRHGSATQLIVDGKPFLVLGGELGNSSASNMEYMRDKWATLRKLNLNTVIAPAYWELIEPVEGRFDFRSVDSLLFAARKAQLRVVLLWFGAWKNSMSTYVPSWVKRDQKRFPRVQVADGSSVEILSAFSANTRDADVRAFGRRTTLQKPALAVTRRFGPCRRALRDAGASRQKPGLDGSSSRRSLGLTAAREHR